MFFLVVDCLTQPTVSLQDVNLVGEWAAIKSPLHASCTSHKTTKNGAGEEEGPGQAGGHEQLCGSPRVHANIDRWSKSGLAKLKKSVGVQRIITTANVSICTNLK